MGIRYPALPPGYLNGSGPSFPFSALWNILCFQELLYSEQPQEGPGSQMTCPDGIAPVQARFREGGGSASHNSLKHSLGNHSEALCPREQACLGVILRAPAFPLTSTYKSPLLSHQLNLNKSSPSWPHPPASAFLPRGPVAPTTQAVWEVGGGAALLPEGGLHTVNTCTQPRCCLRSLSHALLQHTHV